MSRPAAVVTGAGSGIGAAVAVRLAESHDLVLTHLRSDDDLDHVVARTQQAGAVTRTVAGDLTAETTIKTLEDEVNRAGNDLTVLVSNAGAYPRLRWDDTTMAEFREQVDVNLFTHAACAKIVTPHLKARGDGRIVTVSSVLTQLGYQNLAGYIAAKSGLEGLTRALARELGPSGITVNCIRAGSIAVPAEHEVVADHDAMVVRQLDRQSIKRRGEPEDIAAAVEFLISDGAGFITGQCLTVDGGWYLA